VNNAIIIQNDITLSDAGEITLRIITGSNWHQIINVVIDEKNIVKLNLELSLNPILSSLSLEVADEAVDQLITEGGNDFYNYLKKTGLAKEDLIVLYSRHGYFYGEEEMTFAKTIVNLKELNHIPDIKSFFHSQLNILPQKCNYIGCFVNSNKHDHHRLRSGSADMADLVDLGIYSQYAFLNRLYSIFDSRTNSYMSERSVTLLFRMHGFEMQDMTECNGITFFHSQKSGNMLN
jgi:hypothetical protein